MGDGERYIRGGVVDPMPRKKINRILFHHHSLHQKTRHENETLALDHLDELRDDFALRGRCEMFRVDLKSMAAARNYIKVPTSSHRLGKNATFPKVVDNPKCTGAGRRRGHLAIFKEHHDLQFFMERHAMRRGEFRN